MHSPLLYHLLVVVSKRVDYNQRGIIKQLRNMQARLLKQTLRLGAINKARMRRSGGQQPHNVNRAMLVTTKHCL
jgi:hypothetical protein